jgi:hypothetical protein
LKTKDETDFNGNESYIAEKFEKEDISWFPLHKALSLTKETNIFSSSKFFNLSNLFIIEAHEEEDSKEP